MKFKFTKLFLMPYLRVFVVFVTSLLTFAFFSCKDDDDTINDNSVPEIYITSPETEDVYVTIENKITIKGVARDDMGLKTISWTSNNGKSGEAVGLEEWTIADLELTDGENTIVVKATDVGGNSTEAKIVILKNKYIYYLGMPKIDPPSFFSGTNTPVRITATVIAGENFIESSVKLIEVDKDGKLVAEVCPLFDSGNLNNNGDEIKGDNVFSAKYNFNIAEPGKKHFRVVASTSVDAEEVIDYSAILELQVIDKDDSEAIAESLFNLHVKIEEKLKSLESNSDKEAVKKEILEFLKGQPEVKSAKIEGDYIAIEHQSGLISYAFIQTDKETKGGSSSSKKRSNTPSLPLVKQTRGTYGGVATIKNSVDQNIIQNKNVLIWAPYQDEFPVSMESVLKPIFDASELDLKLTYVTNNDCNIASLQSIVNYGVVILDTHGVGGDLVLTKQKQENKPDMSILLGIMNRKIIIVTMGSGTYYGVTSKFFSSDLNGFFPNSVIFNGSCESTKTDQLEKAFIGRGAKTYLGFSESVLVSYCNTKSVEFFTNLTGEELKTTGDSFEPDSYTIYGLTGYYQLKGSAQMKLFLGFINGDFEYGNLHGWSVEGDGRVITKLVNLSPQDGKFMGIISTGLGYTTQYGSISQTFKVTDETKLTMKWNFLSEEFLEYVGSQFQDYLRVSLTAKGESSELLYFNAIDGFYKDFELISVSPDIVFDRAGVYMTGWQTSSFDISKYQGKTVTLKIESGDVGDSIFDSATLLDAIAVTK